jgi:hypothetical protein
VIANHNGGPSVCFRLYPDEAPTAAASAAPRTAAACNAYEVEGFPTQSMASCASEYVAAVEQTSLYHKVLFDLRRDEGLFTDYVRRICERVVRERACVSVCIALPTVAHGGDTVLCAWFAVGGVQVQRATHSRWNDVGECISLPGEKCVFLNPMTTRAHIDEFVAALARLVAAYPSVASLPSSSLPSSSAH